MGFQRQGSSLNLPSANSSTRCCDYKKLNILAFAGALVYVGYLFGSTESSGEAAFSNDVSSSDERRTSLRVATASASWDRILDSEKSEDSAEDEEKETEENSQDEKDVPAVVDEIPSTNYAGGPVIYDHDGPATTISLIGERHSGTNWITDHLEDCFGDRIKVSAAEELKRRTI